jgi:hypothetical protein
MPNLAACTVGAQCLRWRSAVLRSITSNARCQRRDPVTLLMQAVARPRCRPPKVAAPGSAPSRAPASRLRRGGAFARREAAVGGDVTRGRPVNKLRTFPVHPMVAHQILWKPDAQACSQGAWVNRGARSSNVDGIGKAHAPLRLDGAPDTEDEMRWPRCGRGAPDEGALGTGMCHDGPPAVWKPRRTIAFLTETAFQGLPLQLLMPRRSSSAAMARSDWPASFCRIGRST